MAHSGDIDLPACYAARAMAVDSEEPAVLYNVAYDHGIVGRRKTRLDLLERAIAQGLGGNACQAHGSDLDVILEQPRDLALIRSVKRLRARDAYKEIFGCPSAVGIHLTMTIAM